MRINSGSIGMESERTYFSRTVRATKMTITDVRQQLSAGTGSLPGNLEQSEEQRKEFDKEKESAEEYMERAFEEMRSKQAARTRQVRSADVLEMQKKLNSIRQQCLNYLMDTLFMLRRGIPREETFGTNGFGTGTQSGAGPSEKDGENAKSDWDQQLNPAKTSTVHTFSFSRQYYHEETEQTAFQTQGTVKCADGREISFNLNLYMSRSFSEYYEENYMKRDVVMCDPLVINLDGSIPQLTDQTFLFDIDGDGMEDEISRLGAGSGYLALDKNNDGIINDGTELFGTASGDGFSDLAAYDSDGNGFIDEGDEIWSKLKIWIMDENGNQQLVSLAEKGVGAICLKSAATDYSLTGQDGAVRGAVRSTGFFLYENGAPGSVQHVDVVKYNQAV